MIDFDEELKKFRPALDVDDIEEYIGSMDLTDMNDIYTFVMRQGSAPSVKNYLGSRESER